MSMEQFSSALAPAIRDLILFKRECVEQYISMAKSCLASLTSIAAIQSMKAQC